MNPDPEFDSQPPPLPRFFPTQGFPPTCLLAGTLSVSLSLLSLSLEGGSEPSAQRLGGRTQELELKGPVLLPLPGRPRPAPSWPPRERVIVGSNVASSALVGRLVEQVWGREEGGNYY
jgi:hypothetical protein